VLLYLGDERGLAHRIARAAGLPPVAIKRHRFPDQELRVTLPPRVPRRVVVLRSLNRPNEKLIELLLVTQTARSLGARHVTLVAPYLAYMRQDRAFGPGEAVSQRHVGALLGALFDRLVTVDPHLHRVSSLSDVIPESETVALSAAPLLGAFLRRRVPGAILIGPDEESAQWVEAAARAAGAEWAVARKKRRGDRRVTIDLPAVRLDGRRVVLLDDVVSTGGTLIEATCKLKEAGAARVDVAITHALFGDETTSGLHEAGVRTIWSTDTVAHPTNAIRVAPLLAAALADRSRLTARVERR
jgi:ribose-phosphate pyrophosphokinase